MDNDLTLKDAALKLGFVTEEQFDRVLDPAKMVHPYVAETRKYVSGLSKKVKSRIEENPCLIQVLAATNEALTFCTTPGSTNRPVIRRTSGGRSD